MRTFMKPVLSIITLLTLAIGTTAYAQISSPPPPLMGQPSAHLWSIPGVVDSGSASPFGLGTFFACTNTATADIRVGVEVFDDGGVSADDPSATSVNMPAGATRTFATGSELGWPGSVTILSTGMINGSARVLATGKGIMCSAFMADRGTDPPTPTAKLTVVKKTKEKGE